MKRKALVSRDPQIVAARILDAAETVFLEDGFAGASTNRILELFGGSKATLFRHFPTKTDMLTGVVRRIGERVTEAADWDGVDNDQPPEDYLTEFGARAMRVILREDSIFVGRMVVAQGRNYPILSETFTAVAISPMLKRLAKRFAAWTAQGKLASEDPKVDANRYFDLALSGWISACMFGINPPLTEKLFQREARASAQLFLHGRAKRRR